MDGLLVNRDQDPNHTPHVLAYEFGDLKAVNPRAQLDAGIFVVPLNVKTSSGMDYIILSIQYGETVQVQAA